MHFLCVALGEAYERYIGLNIATALHHNPMSSVEVVVLDVDAFMNRFGCEIDACKAQYLGNVHVRATRIYTSGRDKLRLFRNAVRFLEVPEHMGNAELTYIGDVDIIYTESVVEHHIAEMRKTKLPFSNFVRENGSLTGLHCVSNGKYYTGAMRNSMNNMLQHIDSVALQTPPSMFSDEITLTTMCAEHWDVALIAQHTKHRPEFGVHYSVSRMDYEKLASDNARCAALVNRATPHEKNVLQVFSETTLGKTLIKTCPNANELLTEVMNLRETKM